MHYRTQVLFLCFSFSLVNQVRLFAIDEKIDSGKTAIEESTNENIQDSGKKAEKKEFKQENFSDPKQEYIDSIEGKKQEKEQPKKRDTQVKKVIPDKEKASSRITEKSKASSDERILANPVLTDDFKDSFEISRLQSGVIYFFYGAVSGGLMGLGGGFSFYKTTGVYTPLFITAAGLGAAGGLTGIIVSIIENSTHNPLIGAGLFENTWYGLFGGAAVGTLIGLIPYATSNNIITLLNWVGYGAFGGLVTGMVLYFVAPKIALKNLIIDINPIEPKIGYRFQF